MQNYPNLHDTDIPILKAPTPEVFERSESSFEPGPDSFEPGPDSSNEIT